jgi:hypothetical protein
MKIDVEKFKKVPYKKRDKCQVCGAALDGHLIDLPDFPMTEIYTGELIKEKVGFADQGFQFCSNCGHGQISNVIDVGLQYGDSISYHFRTSGSATGRESADFFIDFFNDVVKNRRFKSVVEVGCNDLYILKALTNRADRLIGIDPILKGKEQKYSSGNIIAIGDFLENIKIEEGIDLVICKDTLEHVSEPKQFVKKIVDGAHDETLFFFQFPYLETLLDGCRFDQIFHQHLNYFSLRSTIYMLEELGCELLDYRININHWGAVLIAFKKSKKISKFKAEARKITDEDILSRYKTFKADMKIANDRLLLLRGEKVYGYGAALMLPVLSYHLGNDFAGFEFIIDDDKNKEGLYYINLPVAIRTSDKVRDFRNAVVMLTAISAMNNGRRILAKLFELNPKQIIVPMSTL